MFESTYIIAEIGINHEGSFARCKEMFECAKDAGADAVKLQIIDAEKCYARESESFELFKGASLNKVEIADLFDIAKAINLDIFATAADLETIAWVDRLNPSAWKISSGLLTHHEVIKYIVSLERKIFVSTGMASGDDIDSAMKILARAPKDEVILMHCVSLYPTPISSANLKTIEWLKEQYGVTVGYSDHSVDYSTCPIAVALGAQAIEKHFTFDMSRQGYDHHVSITPAMFREMVSQIREVETMLGYAGKIENSQIQEVKRQMSRWVVAVRSLKAGHRLTNDDIEIKRPSKFNKHQIAPSDGNKTIGCILQRDYLKGEAISYSEVADQ